MQKISTLSGIENSVKVELIIVILFISTPKCFNTFLATFNRLVLGSMIYTFLTSGFKAIIELVQPVPAPKSATIKSLVLVYSFVLDNDCSKYSMLWENLQTVENTTVVMTHYVLHLVGTMCYRTAWARNPSEFVSRRGNPCSCDP